MFPKEIKTNIKKQGILDYAAVLTYVLYVPLQSQKPVIIQGLSIVVVLHIILCVSFVILHKN